MRAAKKQDQENHKINSHRLLRLPRAKRRETVRTCDLTYILEPHWELEERRFPAAFAPVIRATDKLPHRGRVL